MYDGRMIKYRVHVHTGDKTGAGTKADIRITLVGDKGRTEERSLANSRTHKVTFQKGQEDIFDLDSYFVGPLRKIFIGHDRTEMGTDWYLDHVTVKDMANQFQYHINCDTWLSSRSDDKLTFRGFPVKSSHRFSQNEEEERDRHYGNQQEAHIAIVHTNPRVEQAPPADERTLKTEPTGSASRTSTRTQYSDRNHGNSSSDSDTSETYTTSEVPSSTRYRSKDAPVRSHVSPRSPPMKRSDNFFDQTVKEKDYSSVIESLSVTTDQDNRDDFDSERRVRPPRDRSHLGITVRPVEGDGLALNEQRVTTPVRGHGDSSDSSDDEQTARIEAAPGQPDARQPDPVNPDLVKPEQTEEDKLFTAAKYGDLNTLKRIIQDKPHLKNETTEHGWTVLHVATDAGHTDMVQWLTLQMTDLEMETPTGNTPMHLAASNGHVATMRILFAMGASVNSKSYAGQTPLHMAAESGHLDAVKYLVASRADLDVRDVSGNSAEDMAAISNTSGADSCHRYLEQCAAEQQKPDSKLADMRSNPEGSKRPTSAQSTSTVDSSTSSSYTSSSSTYSSHSRHDDDNDDEELNEKQKKKHDDEIMEKKRLYEEQQTKMADKQLSFMDSIRQDVN